MKVKVGELKTNLSNYLRRVRDNGEEIEVCIREEAVAYLVPSVNERKRSNAVLREKLAHTGLKLGSEFRAHKRKIPTPRIADDNQVDVDTVKLMREQKDW